MSTVPSKNDYLIIIIVGNFCNAYLFVLFCFGFGLVFTVIYVCEVDLPKLLKFHSIIFKSLKI